MFFKILKALIAWITFTFSGPLLLISLIDFFRTKDYIDIVLFVVFLGPFCISFKYLMKCWKEKSRKKPTIKRSVQVEKIDAIVENSEKLPSKIFEPVTTQELNKQEFKNPADTIQALHEDDKETILKIPKSSEKSELSKIPPEKVSTQVYNEKAIIKADNVPGNSLCYPSQNSLDNADNEKCIPGHAAINFPDWYVSLSFEKSSSSNYLKAVSLAKSAPQYLEQTNNGKILHQAVYSSKPNEYLAFIMLYELVKMWKSAFVIINGRLIDRKIIGQLNYCYGDKCRSGNLKFCYGASYMTDNPFGCHRLQISTCNNPWWSYYQKRNGMWILDKESMLQRINSYASIYSICPDFNYDKIMEAFNQLPSKLSNLQYQKVAGKSALLISAAKSDTINQPYIQNEAIKRLIPKCKEWKVDTFLITTRRSCPVCGKYNRKIYSLYGWNKKYPRIPNDILCSKCPQCGGSIGATIFFPGVSSTPK